MPGKVVVIAGPAGSGKTAWLLERYRDCFRPQSVGAGLWISPTHRSAACVRDRLLTENLRACFAPAVMTFSQFAERVLAASERHVQPISDLVKRQIVRRLILTEAAAQRLPHFQPIASTAGLIDLTTEFISELKRHEIWPEDFASACKKRGWQQKDRELLAIYEAYQNDLNRGQLYDAEGRFWTARELLKQGQREPFSRLAHVVVDGFADFTRTQHEILAILAERVTDLHISLPLEPEEQRRGFFAKPGETLKLLSREHKNLELVQLARHARPAWPGLAHVEQELFKNPRHVQPAANLEHIEVVEAARAIDELYLIGRRIKRLLICGDPTDGRPVRPGDVTVVLRSPGAMATLVREAFDELGLPYVLESGRPLSAAPIAAALVAVVRLHVEDWPFRGVLALLAHSYFAPDWPEGRQGTAALAADRAIRELEIARGRSQLLAALDEPEFATARALLARLAVALDRLPKSATLGQWAKALAGLAAETGLLRTALAAGNHDPIAKFDRAAWDSILESLNAIERVATAGKRPAEQFAAADLLELLTDVLSSQSVLARDDETGCVRVLSATSARALSTPYLFFAGLSERAFPSPERADRLYNEAEYERFAAAGLPLALRAATSQDEMLLFYEVVTRAERHLCLSYPGLDEKGHALLPSPYLLELEQVCGDRVERLRIEDLSPLPRADEVASAADQRILGVAQAVGIERALAADRPLKLAARGTGRRGAGAKRDKRAAELLAGLSARPETRDVFNNILTGLAVNDSRGDREVFGPYEGMLDSDAARAVLAKKFGPEVHFSASRLEQFGSCPFRFFLEQVLKVEPLETLSLAADPLSRGSNLHAGLARLHRELNAAHGGPISPAAPEAEALFRAGIERFLNDLAQASGGRVQAFQRALDEIDRRVLERWLKDYLEQHKEYDKLAGKFDELLGPAHFEVSFGEEVPSDDPLSVKEPLALDVGGQTVLIRGRIDRIDLGRMAGTPVFGVVDYKTGRARSRTLKDIQSGHDLQVSLYTLAVEQLLLRDGRLPWAMGYWSVSDGGYKKNQAAALHKPDADSRLQPTEDWQTIRARVAARVGALVNAIRGGQFPVASHDEHCTTYCSFSTVCRVNQVRSLGKEWVPR